MAESWHMQRRRTLHEQIQEAAHLDPSQSDSLVTGWVIVYELMCPNNETVLVTESSDATGETALRPWTEKGWLHWAANAPEEYYEDEDESETGGDEN